MSVSPTGLESINSARSDREKETWKSETFATRIRLNLVRNTGRREDPDFFSVVQEGILKKQQR